MMAADCVAGIAALLPRHAVSMEATGRIPADELYPEELDAIAHTAPKRRLEFAAGRSLARAALQKLGVPPQAIPVGVDRAPRWPSRVVGSITHCEGYCAAAVAPVTCVRGLGIDAEPHRRLPSEVLPVVTIADERRWIDARVGDGIWWDRLLFSAKESVFKAWFPLTGCWLEFHEVRVTFAPESGWFQAMVAPGRKVDSGATALHGRWRITASHVLTAISIPAIDDPCRGQSFP